MKTEVKIGRAKKGTQIQRWQKKRLRRRKMEGGKEVKKILAAVKGL